MFELNFAGHAAEYEVCYQACLMTRKDPNAQERRTMGKLLDKLESVGKVVEGVQIMGMDVYELNPNSDPRVFLESNEKKLLVGLIEECQWRPAAVRKVNQTEDWLKDLPTFDPKKNLKVVEEAHAKSSSGTDGD